MQFKRKFSKLNNTSNMTETQYLTNDDIHTEDEQTDTDNDDDESYVEKDNIAEDSALEDSDDDFIVDDSIDNELDTDVDNYFKIDNTNFNLLAPPNPPNSPKDYRKLAIDTLDKIYKSDRKCIPKIINNKFKEEIKKLKELLKEYKDKKEYNNKVVDLENKILDFQDLNNKMIIEMTFLKLNFNTLKFIRDERKKLNSLNSLSTAENDLFMTIFFPQQSQPVSSNFNKRQKKSIDNEFEELYDNETNMVPVIKYYNDLDNEQKQKYLDKLKEVKQSVTEDDKKPNYIKILDCNTSNHNKSVILQKINIFENLKGSSEINKLRNWINKVMKVPFGKYVLPTVTKDDGVVKIKNYLQDVRSTLDKSIYGHDVTKDQLIKIIAHTITNPQEGGNVFALQGPPGVGKTALIQDGIAKAINRPFTFISLGGATDACFLEGHDYTYEGSNHGRIVEILQQAKCMNPVIYFDELDKISETHKGEEIVNILMHITDSTQNSHFNDKYFGSVDFDLSKCLLIFSFNDENKISRILRDRMKIIRVKGYKIDEKLHITKDYVLQKLYKEIGLEDLKIEFSDDVIKFIIENYTNEGGVRKLKETLKDILLEINLRRLEGDKTYKITKKRDKIVITKEMIEGDFLRKKRKLECLKINEFPKVGIVNGLWANELGVGGLVPIECCWIPSKDKLELELTGMQGKVMKESMSVARTIVWRILPEYIKERINERCRTSFDCGIHIHCPDGATPKDGPSAGGAITTCLFSLLTNNVVNNKIAMTGEINLKGQITAIGGLEEKIFGAKKAGAELVLCPKDNEQDLNEIRTKFPYLIGSNFNVRIVRNIWDILDVVMVDKIDYVRFD